MKKIIFIAIALLAIYASRLSAQEEQPKRVNIKTNEDFFNNAKFIVEGRLINGVSYDAKGLQDRNDIYTEIRFVVNYIYKDADNILKQSDTIMIVQNIGGMIWNDQLGDMIITTEKDKDIDESDGTENVLPPGHSRYGISLWGGGNHKCNFIFFLNESNYPDNPDKKNHYYRTRFLENSIPSGFMQHGGIGGLIGLYFPDRYELYKYMQQFEGVNVPLSDLKKMERDLSGRPDAWKQYLQDRNMKWGQERNDSIKKDMLEKHEQIKKSAQQNKLKGAKATNYATFIVSNYEQTYDSTETSFLTFDISVSVNNSNAYMFYIAPRIQYNTAAFGSNIVNGGKVTIDTNYINATYQEVFADFDNNLLGIIDLQCYNR